MTGHIFSSVIQGIWEQTLVPRCSRDPCHVITFNQSEAPVPHSLALSARLNYHCIGRLYREELQFTISADILSQLAPISEDVESKNSSFPRWFWSIIKHLLVSFKRFRYDWVMFELSSGISFWKWYNGMSWKSYLLKGSFSALTLAQYCM